MKAAMLLFLICIPFASAQTDYKTVDEQGRVSYTSTPPSGGSPVEELVPPPEPSAEAVEAARQREKDLQEAAQAQYAAQAGLAQGQPGALRFFGRIGGRGGARARRLRPRVVHRVDQRLGRA